MNNKGMENPNYRHGRCVENRCSNCNTLIDWRSKYCVKCRASLDNPFKGKKHSEKTKAIIGKKSKEKFTPEFIKKNYQDKCSGNKKMINGYILIKDYKHPNRNSQNDVLEHILVMSNHIGRPISKGEVIHHIDFDRANNDISNLHLYKTRSEHLNKSQGSIFKLVKFLLKRNIITFTNGEYKLVGGGEA